MDSINLLPTDQRQREALEEKELKKARENYIMPLSKPLKEEKKNEPVLYSENIGLAEKFKKWLKNRKQSREDLEKEELKLSLKVIDHEAQLKESQKTAFNMENLPSHQKVVEQPKVVISQMDAVPGIPERQYSAGEKLSSGIEVNFASGIDRTKEIGKNKKILVFVAMFLTVAVILAGWRLYLDGQVKKGQKRMEELTSAINGVRAKMDNLAVGNGEIEKLQPRLLKLDELLSAHIWPHKIFDYLEQNTVKGVYYVNMSVNASLNSITLRGVALDYASAARQLLVFNDDKENIVDVSTSQIAMEKEKSPEGAPKSFVPREMVNFTLNITLNPSFFLINETGQ